MKTIAIVLGLMLVAVLASAQPKSVPEPVQITAPLRFTCDEGFCTMPLEDLRALVETARVGCR